ncbi:MAG TPA: PQQ-binding-like beta-propeller repeat protein [Ktedonobacterales bacterium]|nr:PQQ-binding-like beta-propeller repeat protein [Ktedonobacterales bacterium]
MRQILATTRGWLPMRAWQWLICIALLPLAACGGAPAPLAPLALTPGAATPHPLAADDWTMYHRDAARTGNIAGLAAPNQLTRAWRTTLDGAVYAEPLVIGNTIIAATEHDSLYALDLPTGHVRWKAALGTPVPRSALPCGNIDPLGITGTPVFDSQTGLIYAVAEVAGPTHILVGVDLASGRVRVRRSADPPGMDPATHQQRGALALANGWVYVPYGGLYGDCGDYHGRVVAARTDGTGALLTYQVPTTREGGIWATPGPVMDARGDLYVAVGNGAATGGTWDHSDAILRLSPTLQLLDGFAPRQWAQDNAGDADLGSMAPVLLPGGMIFADGKSGQGYLLRADQLGGVGGQAQSLAFCRAYGGAAVSGAIAIIPCTDGLRQLRLEDGPHAVAGWHAPGNITGSPVIGGQTVYALDPGGTLYALDLPTGAVRAQVAVDGTSRFATPTLAHGDVFVGTLAGVEAFRAS